ncbi:glutamyl-tRNA reductase [Candidatus Vesicomyidisocius sp. SY067_SCS001]|uniref:glutamyl-tRNA reductase n=1 Tax=Candidatus Vesicomyidisocius sp. SY067_SCS001 TaxID=2732590 RepID=UPI001689FDDF|nr:glutamyl-tRNA reductase [Candidatus Vesicomyosocius sp. SY067_SCS001]
MSQIAILSINHQLAPVEVREKVAFTPDKLTQALSDLHGIYGIYACIILSTCNRVEIYVNSDNENPKEVLSNYLAKIHDITRDRINPYLNYFEDNEALTHVCNVATGLDSLVLGEPQILGQLKDAYHIAKEAKTLNKLLEKLFQHAFSTAKKVRTDTQIGVSPVSIAYCSVKLSEKIFERLSEQTVLLIGAGEMIELCAQYLNKKKVSNMIIANRTIENAQKIANLYQAQAISLKQFSSIIHKADIIISSTAASVPIIGKGLIESALKKRKHKPIFMLDIAIPRDIEPEVGQLDDIYLYTIDDLEQVINDNIGNREKEKNLAQEIIIKQNQVFNQWLKVLPNEQLVRSYRSNANLIKDKLLEKAIKQIKHSGNYENIIRKFADQLTNKLLHLPSKNIKQTSANNLSQCEGCIPNIKK